MNTSLHLTAVAVFDDWRHAQDALHQLLQDGFQTEDIGMLARGGDHWVWDASVERPYLFDAKPRQSAVGAYADDLWKLRLSAGRLPEIGSVIAAGTLRIIFELFTSNAVRKALALNGVEKTDSLYLEDRFMAGRTLLVVESGSRYADAIDVLDRNGSRATMLTAVPEEAEHEQPHVVS